MPPSEVAAATARKKPSNPPGLVTTSYARRLGRRVRLVSRHVDVAAGLERDRAVVEALGGTSYSSTARAPSECSLVACSVTAPPPTTSRSPSPGRPMSAYLPMARS
jgi:hypothetical protein